MERSEWSGMLEPEPGCLRWGNLTKERWCGVENSWARNQLASHNEGLLRLLLFSGGVIEEHGARERRGRKKTVGRVRGAAVARMAIMLPLSPDNIKCPSPTRAAFFVILHNLFLAIVPAIEFLLRLVEGEKGSVARRSGGDSRLV